MELANPGVVLMALAVASATWRLRRPRRTSTGALGRRVLHLLLARAIGWVWP